MECRSTSEHFPIQLISLKCHRKRIFIKIPGSRDTENYNFKSEMSASRTAYLLFLFYLIPHIFKTVKFNFHSKFGINRAKCLIIIMTKYLLKTVISSCS